MIFPLVLLDTGLLKNGSDQQCSFKQCKKTESLSLLLSVEDASVWELIGWSYHSLRNLGFTSKLLLKSICIKVFGIV